MYSFYPLGTTLSLNQLLGDPWKHCKDAQGRQGHVEVQLFYENHCKFKKRNTILCWYCLYLLLLKIPVTCHL